MQQLKIRWNILLLKEKNKLSLLILSAIFIYIFIYYVSYKIEGNVKCYIKDNISCHICTIDDTYCTEPYQECMINYCKLIDDGNEKKLYVNNGSDDQTFDTMIFYIYKDIIAYIYLFVLIFILIRSINKLLRALLIISILSVICNALYIWGRFNYGMFIFYLTIKILAITFFI